MKKVYPCRDPELRNLIIVCMLKRFNTRESLVYLHRHEYDIKERTLRKIKHDIRQGRFKEIREILDHEIIDQHLDSIQTLNQSLREMWQQYERENDPSKKVDINIAIVNLLPIRSNYYYNTAKIITKEKIEEIEKKIKYDPLSV